MGGVFLGEYGATMPIRITDSLLTCDRARNWPQFAARPHSTVDVLPVPDLENDDHEFPAGHAIDDAIYADPDPEHIVIARELARARWVGLLPKREHGPRNAPAGIGWEFSELLLGGPSDLEAIPSHGASTRPAPRRGAWSARAGWP